jgi:hypothetical protein
MSATPPAGDAAVDDDDRVAALQAALVRSVVDGAPLPGGTPSPELPDLALAQREGVAPLLDEELPAGLAPALPRSVRLVTRDALQREAAARGDTAFLRLAPPTRDGATLWLALEVRLAPAGGGRDAVLGGVQVGLRAEGEGWRVVEAPRAFAV